PTDLRKNGFISENAASVTAGAAGSKPRRTSRWSEVEVDLHPLIVPVRGQEKVEEKPAVFTDCTI
ncbi:MAG: hypothetical protein NTU53_14485, partial [Planctomycetota bacterium]|nr:hypothetical protein [Planctomycetota bacterium]